MTFLPKVSICLPNLNNRDFLEERLDSILAQTFQDWELIIYDSHSDDGAWELLQEYGKQDSRISLHQGPRGLYQSWNACLNLAHGAFVYFATSDDTMSPECLEKLTDALRDNPDCDICQCGLQMIDQDGRLLDGDNGGPCWEAMGNAKFLGEWLKTPHLRRAPHDGLVAVGFGTAWTSMTQVLVRRRLYEKVGTFPTHFGAVGDAAWQMKAGFFANVIFLPEKLATWRHHEGQESRRAHTRALAEGWIYKMGLETLDFLRRKGDASGIAALKESGILDLAHTDFCVRQLQAAFQKPGFKSRAEAVARLACGDIKGMWLALAAISEGRLGISLEKNALIARGIALATGAAPQRLPK